MAEPLTRTSRYLLAGLLAIAVLLPYTVSDQFIIRLAIQSGIFILLASAHNILMKVGLLSLGPVAFYGLGAYVSAILTTRYDVPFPVAFLAAGLAATAAGWIIGRLTLRLRAAYFVLVTLGFAECFRLVALNWIDMTNGPMGITAVPPPARWFVGYVPYFYFILLLVVLTLFGLYRMEHSTIGRAMQAIRQNELLAGSVGISGFRYMMLAALLASFIMGLAGSFYAHFFQFLGPEILAFDLTIAIVVMVVAGGRATLMGPVLGAIVFTVLPEVLRVVQVWRMAIFGLLLMLMMLFMPDGIWPALQLLAQRCFERVTGRRTPAVVPSSLGSPSGSFAADSSRPPVPARVEH
ncbi:MAG: branched-chain amino acid ABC transporter permease, partial [Candidatus Latescibacterota bacterium]